MTQLDGASAAPPAAPESRPVAIRADGVERVFPTKRGGVHALGPVDLTVHDGKFVCIVGPSGCGKSTFMRIAAGLMRPSAGRLEVRQRDGHPDAAVVFQDYSILGVWQADHRTVLFITHSLEEAALLADRVLVMSNRPGRILADRTVPFDRPRTGALRNSSEFGAFRQELWELLRGEVHDT